MAKVKKKDLGRFAEVYEAAPKTAQTLALKLIANAIFMEDQLEKLQETIKNDGPVSEYQNGENQWGTKKSPEVEIYNTMVKNYTSTIKQLGDLLGPEVGADDELTRFLAGGRR